MLLSFISGLLGITLGQILKADHRSKQLKQQEKDLLPYMFQAVYLIKKEENPDLTFEQFVEDTLK